MNNYISDFLFHCEIEKKLNPKTLKAYQTDLSQFYNFTKKEKLNEIQKEELKSYFLYLSKFASKTMKRKIATLKSFFSYLEFEDILENNPFRKVRIKIKNDIILPKTLSIEEITSILKKVYEHKNSIPNKRSFSYKEAIRNIAIIELLFASGIRVSELCHLKNTDIANDFSLIKIFGKGNKERTIPLTNKATQNALKENQKKFKNNSYLFVNRLGNRLSEQSVRFLVKKLAIETKIQRHITPHIFRHSFATLLLESDADIRYIQHLLGHSSIAVTQIYTHVNERKKKEVMALKNPRNLVCI